jgi:20S proteasome subunit beta 7
MLATCKHCAEYIFPQKFAILLLYSLSKTICGDAGCYGLTVRYKSVEHLKPIRDNTNLGANGEISDFQAITNILD